MKQGSIRAVADTGRAPRASGHRLPAILPLLCLLGLVLLPAAAQPVQQNPLQPPDTSSPRATLQGFIETMNDIHAQIARVIKSYYASKRLYLSKKEHREIDQALENMDRVKRMLDLGKLPAALVDQAAGDRILQLKEILDRIELPAYASIPDAASAEREGLKRWTIPGTEITIARIDTGPRAGEYLFSADTVERIPEFYRKVRKLPYKPGATRGWYERYRYGGGGLYKIVPYRWMENLPPWSKRLVLEQPVWRWLASALVLLLATGLFLLVSRLGGAWARKRPAGVRPLWARLLRALTLVALMPLLAHILADKLRLSGGPLESLTLVFWGIFTLSLTWSVWLGSNVLAEIIVSSQELLSGSTDGQLVRLALRLVAIIVAISILVVGAQNLGFPAYSVIAGLGVGGVAVALAARDSLANLLGSLLIMFEKPFRTGHWIRVEDAEGTVEGVGFRSTRIRSFYNSVISIPNNRLINSTIDNLGLREYHRLRTVLRLTLDTSPDQVSAFTGGIKDIIGLHPDTRKDYYQVILQDIGEQSLDILVNCFLRVPDWATEMAERERILLDILALAETLQIRFAFPTRTLHVASPYIA